MMIQETFADYRAAPGLNFSTLKTIIPGYIKPKTVYSMNFGKIFHEFVLEPDVFNKNQKIYALSLSKKDYDSLTPMREALINFPGGHIWNFAHKLILGPKLLSRIQEPSFYTKYALKRNIIDLKGRFDLVINWGTQNPIICDLKTIWWDEAGEDDLKSYFYDYQMAYYSLIYEICYVVVPRVMVCFISKKPPYKVTAYQIKREEIQARQKELHNLIERYHGTNIHNTI